MKTILRGESACRPIRCAAICLVNLVVLCVSCLAASITDGCTELPQSRVQTILEDYVHWNVTEVKPRKTSFICFAVRQDQNYAIGYDDGLLRNQDEIAIFDASGNFLYTITFENSGSYSLMWEGETLLIRFSRSGYIYSVDQNGACTAIYDSDDDYEISERFSRYSRVYLLNKDITFEVNGYDYRASTIRLERTDPSGQTTVLYQASSAFKIIPVLLIILFLALWLYLFIDRFRNFDQQK